MDHMRQVKRMGGWETVNPHLGLLVEAGGKTRKVKNPRDYVEQGNSCDMCSKTYQYFSSMKHHRVDSHKLTVESAKEKTDMLRKSVLPEEVEVEGDGRYPVNDCKAQLRCESSQSNHIRNVQGMDVSNVDNLGLLLIRDYFDKLYSVPSAHRPTSSHGREGDICGGISSARFIACQSLKQSQLLETSHTRLLLAVCSLTM